MFLLNNIKVDPNVQRVIGDTQYPPYWFNDPLERDKVGMIEVPNPVKPDDSLFTYVENTDGSYTTTPRTADDIAAYNAAKDAEQSKFIRTQRNAKLNSSDWTQLDDASIYKTAWVTYRQLLRDVPTQADFPWGVTWPDVPV